MELRGTEFVRGRPLSLHDGTGIQLERSIPEPEARMQPRYDSPSKRAVHLTGSVRASFEARVEIGGSPSQYFGFLKDVARCGSNIDETLGLG